MNSYHTPSGSKKTSTKSRQKEKSEPQPHWGDAEGAAGEGGERRLQHNCHQISDKQRQMGGTVQHIGASGGERDLAHYQRG